MPEVYNKYEFNKELESLYKLIKVVLKLTKAAN